MAADRPSHLAASAGLFTAGASRTRGGRNTSRIALLLSLMLVAGALTVPALAKPVEPGITSPESGAEFEKSEGGNLSLEAQASNGTKAVAWSLWIGDPDSGGTVVASDGSEGENPDGFDWKTGLLDVERALESLPSSENYYFVFEENPGDPDSPKYASQNVRFSIFDDTCSGENCTVTAARPDRPSITAKAPASSNATSSLKLGLGASQDNVAKAVSDACFGALADNQRLAGEVSHLIPSDFAGDDAVTVELHIPRNVVEEDTNRGTKSFQVCIAPKDSEEDAYTGYVFPASNPLQDFGLVGPILLNDCGAAYPTACIISRQRNFEESGDLLITYRIPAVDPWMM